MDTSSLASSIARSAHVLTGSEHDYTPLVELIGDARFVLLGEATHGSREFYQERARITARLISECGFNAVAVEADWPDAYRVNRYVRGDSADHGAHQALDSFRRFPNWMWRNTDVAAFVDWLCEHNDSMAPSQHAGFYGLDLYSMFMSIEEVLRYLDEVDPKAAREARAHYGCFDQFGDDSQQYALTASVADWASCEKGALAQLQKMQQRARDYVRGDGAAAADAYFYAQQNARLVKNAEEYYRTMFRGRVSSWNLRDRHMADTLEALDEHLSATRGKPAKIVVWEHNSHIGDARATEIGQAGEWNLGELARKRYHDAVRLVGLSTYSGWVTAASEWDGPAERKQVLPALPDSYEALFHETGLQRFLLPLRCDTRERQALMERRLQRAIGVLYLPRSERRSHYFYAQLPQQFDAIIHIDQTESVLALEQGGGKHSGEAPETYPVGL